MKKNLSLEKIKEERKKSRIDKISSLIKRTIAEIFLTQNFNNAQGKNIIIFVANVFLSGDGKKALVTVDSLDSKLNSEKEIILDLIDKNSAKIKKEFANKIQLRYTPKLQFQVLSSNKAETLYE